MMSNNQLVNVLNVVNVLVEYRRKREPAKGCVVEGSLGVKRCCYEYRTQFFRTSTLA